MVTIAVTAESAGETRVAASPETVKKLVGAGCTVKVQSGAGLQSRFADSLYQAAGAGIAGSAVPLRMCLKVSGFLLRSDEYG